MSTGLADAEVEARVVVAPSDLGDVPCRFLCRSFTLKLRLWLNQSCYAGLSRGSSEWQMPFIMVI